MKVFLFFILAVFGISCSTPKRTESQNDSIPTKDSVQTTNEPLNSFPDRTEFKTYTDKNLKIEENRLWTMKGQDAFYKYTSAVKALDASSGIMLWDSTFEYELTDSLRAPFLYTSSPACCASEDGFTIRNAKTGEAIVRYTYLRSQGSFSYKLGYNAVRAFNFKLNFWELGSVLMGEIFTFDGKVKSILEVRHFGDSVDYSLTPDISLQEKDSVLYQLKNSEIFVNQIKVNSIPESQFYIRLNYNSHL